MRGQRQERVREHMNGTTGHPSLDALLSDELSPAFWRPERTKAESAWGGHIPFAHWLVDVARPRILVELGTHWGVSYSAFCNAVVKANIDTQCFAIDTWKGDEHSGLYPEEVYEDLKIFNEENYSGFSTLLRCTFDDAIGKFSDGTIDLIHIDGLHTYGAVKHDFETWLPKLSNRAIVLLHDTQERREGFGVWRFWSELRERYPSFEFLHSHGLGVLCVGPDAPGQVLALCSLELTERIATIRDRFETIGLQWSLTNRLLTTEQNHRGEIALRDAKIIEQRDEIAAHASQMRALSEQLAALGDEVSRARGDIEKIRNSTSWRVTGPLRFVKTVGRLSVRHLRTRRSAVQAISRVIEALRAGGISGLSSRLRSAEAGIQTNEDYQIWVDRYDTLGPSDIAEMRREAPRFPVRPLISVVLPCYNTSGAPSISDRKRARSNL